MIQLTFLMHTSSTSASSACQRFYNLKSDPNKLFFHLVNRSIYHHLGCNKLKILPGSYIQRATKEAQAFVGQRFDKGITSQQKMSSIVKNFCATSTHAIVRLK